MLFGTSRERYNALEAFLKTCATDTAPDIEEVLFVATY